MSLFQELKRRNVIRVGIAYVIVAWLLMQVADVVLNNITAPDWIFHVLLLFLALGFPLSVFFAWAFELTPEGLKLEKNVDRSQSITQVTGRKLDFTIIGVLVLALGYFAYDKFVLSASREASRLEAALGEVAAQQVEAAPADETEPDRSIAVLPFVNMSDDAGNEFFSDGISEELLNLLAKVPELRVAARTSSFSLKGKELQIAEVGEILKVAHVLEGSVRKAGNQVRITAQLIKIDDGFHMWSDTYDRSLDNIFQVQDEIAQHVVEQLKITLLGESPEAVEVDPEAYALFLQARHLGRMSTSEAFDESVALYQKALEIEPQYAAAWNGLATNYVNMAGNGLMPTEEAVTLSLEATNKALDIDPNFAKGYDGLGWLAFMDNDMPAAAHHYQKALSLDSNDSAILGNAAVIPFSLGRLEEAIALMEAHIARDPVNITAHSNLAQAYLYADRFDDAIQSAKTALRLSPNRLGNHGTIAMAELLKGDAEKALLTNQNENSESIRKSGEILIYHALGRQEGFLSSLEAFEQQWGKEFPSMVAGAYAWSGQVDEAYQWLEKTRESNDPGASFMHIDPFLKSLHDDPRWLPLLSSMGQSPEQLDAVEFEITLPD